MTARAGENRPPRRRRTKYKLCKSCGQPILPKGQLRKDPNEFRHASGCPDTGDENIHAHDAMKR